MLQRKSIARAIVSMLISLIIVGIIVFSLEEIKKRNPKSKFWHDWSWAVITSVVTFATFVIIEGLYSIMQNMRGKPKTFSTTVYIFLLSLLTGVIAGGLYRAKHYVSDIKPDKYSESRMSQLNKVLSSYFGRNWPIVFGIFASLLFLILLFIYTTTKGEIQINVNDQNYGKIFYLILFIGAMITLLTVFLGLRAYKSYTQEQEDNESKLGDFYTSDDSSQGLEIVKYVVLIMVLGFAGIFVVSKVRKL
jgi:magnesium-transporting ATPase (P-type)